MAPGHAIGGIVDKDNGDIFPPGAGVHNFGGANSRQVAVSLKGEGDEMRAAPLDSGGHRWGTPVSRFQTIQVEIVVRGDGATNGSHAHRPFPDVQFIDYLGDETLDDSVPTATA